MTAQLRTRHLPPGPAQSLDARYLGRPVHLLPGFAARVRDDLAEVVRTGLNRRYQASFQLGDATVQRLAPAGTPARWLSFVAPEGRIGFALDRPLLLAALDYRYGSTPAASPSGEAARETATEERLALTLGRPLVRALAARIALAPHEFRTDSRAPEEGAWTLRIEMQEPTRAVEGALYFTLDDALMALLLRHLAPQRAAGVASGRKPASNKPLAQRLRLQLAGRLVDQEMPLGELLNIRPGSVIPVTLGATEVLIDEMRLFRATVAERKGKLCLTSFEDVE